MSTTLLAGLDKLYQEIIILMFRNGQLSMPETAALEEHWCRQKQVIVNQLIQANGSEVDRTQAKKVIQQFIQNTLLQIRQGGTVDVLVRYLVTKIVHDLNPLTGFSINPQEIIDYINKEQNEIPETLSNKEFVQLVKSAIINYCLVRNEKSLSVLIDQIINGEVRPVGHPYPPPNNPWGYMNHPWANRQWPPYNQFGTPEGFGPMHNTANPDQTPVPTKLQLARYIECNDNLISLGSYKSLAVSPGDLRAVISEISSHLVKWELLHPENTLEELTEVIFMYTIAQFKNMKNYADDLLLNSEILIKDITVPHVFLYINAFVSYKHQLPIEVLEPIHIAGETFAEDLLKRLKGIYKGRRGRAKTKYGVADLRNDIFFTLLEPYNSKNKDKEIKAWDLKYSK